jgi:flagellar biosynthesis/type III secretory pathway protein FliH
MNDTTDSYDSPWKEALKHFFPDFLDFFFPDAHSGIDWRLGYEFLDKELQQIVRDAKLGRRTVVMAHLKAQETKRDPVERQGWKLWLTRRLYRLGYNRQQVLDLFSVIDWVLKLPEPQTLDFWQQLQEIEEEKRMRYITSVERIGMKQGHEKGLQQGLQQGKQDGIQQGQAEMVLRLLNRRFGAVSPRLAERVRAVPSQRMPDLLDVALTASVLEEVATTVEALALDLDFDLEG